MATAVGKIHMEKGKTFKLSLHPLIPAYDLRLKGQKTAYLFNKRTIIGKTREIPHQLPETADHPADRRQKDHHVGQGNSFQYHRLIKQQRKVHGIKQEINRQVPPGKPKRP